MEFDCELSPDGHAEAATGNVETEAGGVAGVSRWWNGLIPGKGALPTDSVDKWVEKPIADPADIWNHT